MDGNWAADQQPPSWTACCRNDPPADQPYQQPHTPVHHRSSLTRAEHHRLIRVEYHLLYEETGHSWEHNPVSVTKLTLGLRVGFICSHLIADNLLPVNQRAITGPPKMSLLHEAKITHALKIKPRLILVAHMDNLGWYVISNQQGEGFV